MMRSKMWDYFLQCESDDGVKRAQCTFCERLFSYNSTTYNLKSHLMRAHSKEISLDKGTSDLESVNLEKRKSALKRRNVSVLWSFFTKSNANERLATCNLCSKLFSYKTSTSNLSTHLKRLHPNEFWESKTDDNESGDDDTVEQSNSGKCFLSKK